MRCFYYPLLAVLLGASPVAAQVQQPAPAPPAPLSEDSVRVMSQLVQTTVGKLRSIYFESDESRTIRLVEAALRDIPVANQRLSHYTASLSREQQQALAKRLRQQPWQQELQELQKSPQYRGFAARAARSPALQQAADRLRAAGFLGTPSTPAAPPATVSALAPVVPPKPNAVAAAPAAPPAKAPAEKQPVRAPRHTVQKGETLFSIAKHYQVTMAQLQAWNSKAAEVGVRIGEILVVGPMK